MFWKRFARVVVNPGSGLRPGFRRAHALLSTVAVLIAGGVLPQAASAAAADVSLALLPASASAPAASVLAIEVVALNRSAADTVLPAGDRIEATLSAGEHSWHVTLRSELVSGPYLRLPARGYISRRYDLRLPDEARGRAVLEVHLPSVGTARTVIDIAPNTPGAGAAASAPAAAPVAAAEARMAEFQSIRTLPGELSTYEPAYLIFGADQPRAKFQLSFAYRLFKFGDAQSPHTLQLTYTQRALWEYSSFYDTTYMPGLMYQWLPTEPDNAQVSGVTWLGLQSGWRHESNGRGGDLERAINLAYVRPLFGFGSPQGWYMLLEPQAWEYWGGPSNNPDINRYLGYSELQAVIGRGKGPSLMVTVLPGERFNRGSRELDLSIPLHVPSFHSSIYLLVQYFDGYAESLIGYNQVTSEVRAGMEFVR